EEMAAALAHQLQRLEAMQQAGVRLMARPQLGRDVFGRGAPEGLPRVLVPVWDVSLYDLLQAYGEGRQRKDCAVLTIAPPELHSMDDALTRLERMVGRVPDWCSLMSFLPPLSRDPLVRRSAIAATFAASLELARSGRLQLRQDELFGPIYLRSLPESP
ncbi:MAG TPA: ScpA family protein, partial [Gammaproteobacteria bacterium]|nr:ScpA family protein [Gammaproteobacteria bacterium]